jgi:hypothetical protein
MKSNLIFLKPHVAATLLLALTGAAHGALVVYNETYTTGFANDGYIPDGNPSGWLDSHEVSGLGSGLSITDVRVGLNITGGWNGDLYGYLRYEPAGGGAGTLLVLLDRVGQPGINGGYGNTGFAVTLSDAGAHPIENYQNYAYTTTGSGQVQGTWQANDGAATFGGVGGTFTGLDPNGIWSLFFADRSGIDQSQVVNWSLQIDAVPEPTTWALLGFGAVFGATGALRWWRNRAAGSAA